MDFHRTAAEAELLNGVRNDMLSLVRKLWPGQLTEDGQRRLQHDVDFLLGLTGFYREFDRAVRLRVVGGEDGLPDLVWTRDTPVLTEVVSR